MRYREITEAPISDIHMMGDPESGASFDRGTSFSDTDRKLISSPKGRAKIIRAFRNTPFDFQVVFMNHQFHTNTDADNENVDAIAVEQKAGIHKEWNGIEGEPGKIKVVMVSNLSPTSDKIPMTGWILGHKIGHSIQDFITSTSWNGRVGKATANVCLLINDIYNSQYNYADTRFKHEWSPKQNAFDDLHGNTVELMTMKSARNSKLTNDFEIFPEIIAQYLIKGYVTMNVAQDKKDLALVKKLNQAIFALFKILEGYVLLEV